MLILANHVVMKKHSMILLSSAVLLLALMLRLPAWSVVSPHPIQDNTAGTAITHQNWQRYQQFMSAGMVELFKGTDFWHLPEDVRIEVGPTVPIPLPSRYLADTSRYSNQVRLVRTAAGGYVPVNYVAGLPFPHPLEGDPKLVGQRIFWG